MMFPSEERPRLKGFEVLERLGAGGVGSVYLARSRAGRLVAIKMLGDPRAELDASRKQALAREASLCARLVHPAIVQVRAFVQDAGYAALVFEYVQGVALARLVRYAASRGERLPDRAAFSIVERVLAALSYAHGHRDEAGLLVPIVHRDVSPANVLLDWDGGVKLTDFGMAKMMGTSSGTRAGLVEGTLGCMSPEQARGDSVTERADVYAAALLAWRLATGLSPFAKYRDDEVELLRAMRHPRLVPLGTLRPDLPATVQDAIARALVPEPESRLITAEELRAAVAGSFDCARGEVELRALLSASRASLEAMALAGGVERTYSIVDASAGHTMRYEEVALAFDRDDGSSSDGPPSSSSAVSPLPPMPVTVAPELSEPIIREAPPRAPLPSLDELTVLSELAERRSPPVEGRPPSSRPPRASGHEVARPPEAPSARPPKRRSPLFVAVLVFTVTITGIGVGAGLAWLALGHS